MLWREKKVLIKKRKIILIKIQIKNLLDKLPIEHTGILSKEQKIDISKVQKDNMLKNQVIQK